MLKKAHWHCLVCAGAALLLAGAGSATADPYFSLDSLADWQTAMSEHVRPLAPNEWDAYMQEWQQYTEEGEPYPDTNFRPAFLYPYPGEEFDAPGLVMAWGEDAQPGNSYASAWVYDYGPDPDLSNAVINLSVMPPSFAVAGGGGGITQISFGIQDINGNTRSWYWNVGPGQTIPWNVSTYITIDCSQTGTAATSPAADSYMSNPAFDITLAVLLIADENGAVVGTVPTPPPGGPPTGVWNYWHNVTVEPKLGDTKWEQYPSFNSDPNQQFRDCFWGWDQYSEYQFGPIAADDFLCQTPKPITDIHWWGSYLDYEGFDPPSNAPNQFHLAIWTDVPANSPDNPFWFSHPGTLVKEWWVSRQQVNEHWVGCDFHPNSGVPESTFRYDFLIPQSDWFYQEDGANIYWLSIAPIGDAASWPWGWLTRQPSWNDAAISMFIPTMPTVGSVFQDGQPLLIQDEQWDLAFVLTTTPDEPNEPQECILEFSLDIGSDHEISDPGRDGDEGFDPGDVYYQLSGPVTFPGRDGFKDDAARIFGGFDPWPDAPDPNYLTAAHVFGGNPQDYYEWFDVDGHDQIDENLQQYIPFLEPLPSAIPPFASQCIYGPEYMLVSFDDDMAPGYITADVPTLVPSPAGVSSYGSTAGFDEVVAFDFVAGGFPLLLTGTAPAGDEITVHPSLAPNPDGPAERTDDDVDSLDAVRSRDACPYWYFTVDHEANFGLDPGAIYLATPGGPVQITDEIQFGLSEDTDIDAFEFTWLTGPDGTTGFAVLFSVDDDDPVTPGDESGGLPPDIVFGTTLTGFYFDVTPPLGDDVDAITLCEKSFIPPRPCLDTGDANCDGLVNFGDIDPFVKAITGGQAAWDAAYSCDYFCANDINGDGLVNFGDIDPFVALITGP